MNEKPRELFLKGCNEIAEVLIPHGFRATQKGQRFSKKPNKDITLELYFQSSHYNAESSITIIPHVAVYSKAVKDFDILAYKNEYCDGVVYGNQLCYLLGSEYKVWNLAGAGYADTVFQLQEAISEWMIPIFDLFSHTSDDVINYSIESGFDLSLSYFLVFAGKETAEQVFQTRVAQSSLERRYVDLYEEIAQMSDDDINPNYNEFAGAGTIKMAYLQGLRLK